MIHEIQNHICKEYGVQITVCISETGIDADSFNHCFERDNSSLVDIFGKEYTYSDKIMRIQDVRSLKLWVTNFLSWITDYSASRLHVAQNNPNCGLKKLKNY